MAKKKQFTPDSGVQKSIAEMSDLEFITYADYLSSPYYRAYMNAQHAQGEIPVRREEGGLVQRRQPSVPDYDRYNRAPKQVYAPIQTSYAKTKTKEKSGTVAKGKKYTKKRSLFLILTAVFMLAVLAAGIVGLLNISSVNPYISVFSKPVADKDVHIGLVDPVFGLGKELVNLDVESSFYALIASKITDGSEITAKIAAYAVPVAALIVIICAIVGFVKAIGALCRGKNGDGFYKKFKFGLLSIVMLVCAVVVALGGVFAAGMDFGAIGNFISMKSDALNAGYALFAIIGIPILTFVFSLLSYKKFKN